MGITLVKLLNPSDPQVLHLENKGSHFVTLRAGKRTRGQMLVKTGRAGWAERVSSHSYYESLMAIP